MKRFSLRIWLLLTLLLGYALLLTVSTLIERQSLEKNLIQNETEDIRERLTAFSLVAEIALREAQPEWVNEKIVHLSALPEINAVALVDEKGRVVGASRLEWVGRNAAEVVPGYEATRFQTARTRGLLQIARAQDGSKLTGYAKVAWPSASGEIRSSHTGAAFIDYDLTRQRSLLWGNLLRQNVRAWSLVLALLVGLYWAMNRWLSRPIADMLKAMRRFQLGDLDVRLTPSGSAELAALANGFNDMADEFASTLRAIPDLLFDLDEEGRYHNIWACNEKLLAAQRQDLLQRTVAEMLPADAAKAVMDALGEAAETGMSSGRQICLPLPEGPHWFELSAARKQTRRGVLQRFMLLSRDITPRKLTEIRLAESMRFARATLDALSSHIAILDESGNIIATNRAWNEFARQNGGQEDAIGVGSNYLAACEREASAASPENGSIAQAIRDIIAGKRESYLYEYPCHSPAEQRWYYCRVTRFAGEGPVRVVVAHENITALKEAQARLDASQSVFETLAAVSPVGILQSDAAGLCVYFNRRWRQLAGVSESLGEGWLSAIHPDDQARVRDAWQRILGQGEAARMEYRLRRPGGETSWVIADTAPIYDPQGQYSGWLTTVTDVTEQKLTEQGLRLLTDDLAKFSGEAFFSQMAANLANLLNVEVVSVCRWHPDRPSEAQTIAFIVDGVLKPNISYDMTGTPCAEVHRSGAYVLPSGASAHYPQDPLLTELGIQAYAGVQIAESTGTRFGHLAVMSRRPFKSNHNVAALLKIFAVSCVAELERQRGKKSFADMFELSSDAIILVGSDGRIVMVNRQAEVLFGYSRSGLTGQTVEMLIPENQREKHVALRQGFAGAATGNLMGGGRPDLAARRKDGSTVPVEISLTPLESEEGLLVAASIRDTTERVRAAEALERSARELQDANDAIYAERAQLEQRVEERTAELSRVNAALLQASRDKDNFLATMSHEIRTPLNGMLGMLELLGLSDLDREQKQELRLATESGQSLMRIIDDILDYSKIEAGKLSIYPQPASLSKAVMEVRNMFLANASVKGLALTARVDDRIAPALLFDAFRVAQILKNFVSNAIKFTQQGHIEIRAEWLRHEAAADTVRLSVMDTGMGISTEAQQRLFQPYEQVHDDGGRLYGGTGLGLSICQRLVKMMDGEIAVESTPGMGTTLSVTLSFPEAEGSADDTAVSPPVQSFATLSSNGLPILAADDHPVNRTLLARQLDALGLPVVLAENGVKALQLWRNGQFALVITDCHMPEMDGYTLAARIREIEASEGRPRTPIVAWTAKAFSEDVDLCTRVGMDDFLSKPAALKVLAQTLAKWLPPAPAAGESAAPASTAPFDPAAIKKITSSPAEEAEILREYLTQTDIDLADLKAAAQQSDLPGFIRIAHRMKGASLVVGANELKVLCESAEQAGRAGRTAGLEALILQLDTAVGRLEAYMETTERTTATTVAGIDDAVFDASVLTAMLGDDPVAQRELFEDFLSSLRQLTDDLGKANARQDADTLARIAHKLKSSSRAVGAMQLGTASEALERAGRNGAWPEIAAAYEGFLSARQRLDERVKP